jgi:hypothetical protein
MSNKFALQGAIASPLTEHMGQKWRKRYRDFGPEKPIVSFEFLQIALNSNS